MTRVAIIAALPAELKPMVQGWQHETREAVDLWRWQFDQGEWVAACAGAGVDAATRAFAEVELDGAIDRVVSVGWAGALREEFQAGKAYQISGVVDARTGERFTVSRWPEPDSTAELAGLLTSATVADEPEKRRLAAAYSAGLVDMEAAGVARLAAMRGIPFCCIKGVSDTLRDKLPDFNRFISESGQFRLARFILFVLIRPWYWSALIRMGENSKKAALGLKESLLENLDRRGVLRTRNGYPNFKHSDPAGR
jgi:adenosylhomocysteine nucleosidase